MADDRRGFSKVCPLTPDEAERALYVDFEGTATDEPSLLGVAWWSEGAMNFVQYVLDPDLWPAALAKSTDRGGACRMATWDDLVELRKRSELENRRLIAWSNHERDELATHLTSAGDSAWFQDHVQNAIPLAKRWKREAHPGVVFQVDDRTPLRGRHQLHRYFDLIGYKLPAAFGPGNSAQRIRYVRTMLQTKDGEWSRLTPTAKAKWSKALQHNWHDCNGLRELVVHVAGGRRVRTS